MYLSWKDIVISVRQKRNANNTRLCPFEARAMNIYSNSRVEPRGKLFVKVLSNMYVLFFVINA